MDKSKVEKMSDEQVAQMYELMLAIREQEVEGNEAEVEARRAAEKIDGKH
jgi:TPP-dependent pyruvate/acetoin dehydrogenase alpha subunit